MLKAEDDGGTARHFHYRYGNDVDELPAQDGRYPTMIAHDSTWELIRPHDL